MTFPCFMYHETKAPKGRLFKDIGEYIAVKGDDPGWVDTPAKFGAKPEKSSKPKSENDSAPESSAPAEDDQKMPPLQPGSPAELKAKGKALGIRGWANMSPATLAKAIHDAENKA